jgi:hypothetical protein
MANNILKTEIDNIDPKYDNTIDITPIEEQIQITNEQIKQAENDLGYYSFELSVFKQEDAELPARSQKDIDNELKKIETINASAFDVIDSISQNNPDNLAIPNEQELFDELEQLDIEYGKSIINLCPSMNSSQNCSYSFSEQCLANINNNIDLPAVISGAVSNDESTNQQMASNEEQENQQFLQE